MFRSESRSNSTWFSLIKESKRLRSPIIWKYELVERVNEQVSERVIELIE